LQVPAALALREQSSRLPGASQQLLLELGTVTAVPVVDAPITAAPSPQRPAGRDVIIAVDAGHVQPLQPGVAANPVFLVDDGSAQAEIGQIADDGVGVAAGRAAANLLRLGFAADGRAMASPMQASHRRAYG
jgi:hypothetical protein